MSLTKIYTFILLTIIGISYPIIGMAQLGIDNSLTPSQLVSNVLTGAGVNVTNINYSGKPLQISRFNGNGTNIGLNDGVLLCTGDVNNAKGPNANGSISANLSGLPDIDLATISGGNVYDAAVLEFDFVPKGDSLSFRYVFGSDEYPEYNCSATNDVFGFFVSGPGINGPYTNNAINIALIPGTTVPVAINSINTGQVGGYGQLSYCTPPHGSLAYSSYYKSNYGGATINYDGFTKVLRATIHIQCGQLYHFKIAIADGGNGNIDSGVFLEANSISTIAPFVASTSSTADSILVEGCNSIAIELKRSGDISTPATIQINKLGSATESIDYNSLPNTLNFAANQSAISINVAAIFDHEVELDEELILQILIPYNNSCLSSYDTAYFHLKIKDYSGIHVNAGIDINAKCPGDNQILTAVSSGFMHKVNYLWKTNPIEQTQQITIQPTLTTNYIVQATDSACMNVFAFDTVTVLIPSLPPLVIQASNDTTVCKNSLVSLFANAKGGGGVKNYLWDINNSSASTISTVISSSGIIKVIAKDECLQEVSKQITIRTQAPSISFYYTKKHDTGGEVEFYNTSTNAISYIWKLSDSNEHFSVLKNHTFNSNVVKGYTATLIGKDSDGCIDSTIQYITIYPDFNVYIPNAITMNNDGLNDEFKAEVSGVDDYLIQIFDRWGKKVFETNNPTEGFKPQQNTITEYVYSIYYRNLAGKEYYKTGTLTAVR